MNGIDLQWSNIKDCYLVIPHRVELPRLFPKRSVSSSSFSSLVQVDVHWPTLTPWWEQTCSDKWILIVWNKIFCPIALFSHGPHPYLRRNFEKKIENKKYHTNTCRSFVSANVFHYLLEVKVIRIKNTQSFINDIIQQTMLPIMQHSIWSIMQLYMGPIMRKCMWSKCIRSILANTWKKIGTLT